MKGLTLKGARANAGLTQSDVAKRLGIGESTIRNWEKGRSYPDLPYIDQLCKLYDCKFEDLIFFS